MADDAAEAEAAVDPHAEARASLMAAVDDALAPIHRLADDPGPVNHNSLGVIARAFRHAVSHLVYGPPAKGEAHDVATEQAQEQEAARAQAEQDAADADKPKLFA